MCSGFRERKKTYSPVLNISIDKLASGGIHADAARAVDSAIGDDGLRIYTLERRWGLVGEDDLFGRHFGYGGLDFEGGKWFLVDDRPGKWD